MENLELRRRIAEELLGCTIEDGGFAECPGIEHHTKGKGRKDFRVLLDGAPNGHCLHSHCGDVVAAFNKELQRRIFFAERGGELAPGESWEAGVARAPKAREEKRPKVDMDTVEEFVRGVPKIDESWLARRSSMPVAGMGPGEFLSALFSAGERVLIFTDQRSQGDFLFQVPSSEGGLGGGWRLAQQRGVKAVRSELPKGARDGVWFLVQPVTGKWEIKSDVKYPEGGGRTVNGMYTRRSQVNVSAWRYFVLESDELNEAVWLRVLANLPLPIVAIYTSGGRSIHALIRHPVSSKAAWDATRNMIRQIVCPLGADFAALSAVRLSRLPGCLRGNKPQRLLYLNPEADGELLRLMPELRE